MELITRRESDAASSRRSVGIMSDARPDVRTMSLRPVAEHRLIPLRLGGYVEAHVAHVLLRRRRCAAACWPDHRLAERVLIREEAGAALC